MKTGQMTARLCASILVLEAIVLMLAVPVLINVGGLSSSTALATGGALAVLALLDAGLVRMVWGVWLGHGIQIGMLALGFVEPTLFIAGGIFTSLWVTAVLLGRKIDSDRERWAAE